MENYQFPSTYTALSGLLDDVDNSKQWNFELWHYCIKATIYTRKYILTRGYSKNSKANSKKYFIYEIYKIIFLHQDGIFRWKHRLQKCYELDGNYVEK